MCTTPTSFSANDSDARPMSRREYIPASIPSHRHRYTPSATPNARCVSSSSAGPPVALQVAFENKGLKPVSHFIGSKG
jgi:hypothetical protein